MERKTIGFEVKEIDEEEGTFVGYAATFSKRPDSYGDIIDPGAFSKTLQEAGNRVKILWNHNPDEPIGKPIEMTEDEKGLLIKGKLSLGVQRAREILSLMKDGVVNEMSIGYETIKQEYDKGTRHLKELKLYDTSPVCFAANPEAVVVSVKEENADPFNCECIECGHKMESSEHCADIKCPECGGDMRREERPGPGKSEEEKSGRVLSSANRDKVRAALNALQALLDASAGDDPEKSSQPTDEKDLEAVNMESIVAKLEAENAGMNVRQSEKRIEEILEKIST